MAKKKLPEEVLEYFRKEGAKGGKEGGKKYWASLTKAEQSERNKKAALKIPPEVRKARAQKAAAARYKKRAESAKKKRA